MSLRRPAPLWRRIFFLWNQRRIRFRNFQLKSMGFLMTTLLIIIILSASAVRIITFQLTSTNCNGWREGGMPKDHITKWSSTVDVKAEVERQLLGEPPKSFIINNWTNFGALIEPNCSGWQFAAAAAGNDKQHKEILVIVKTAPDRLAQRQVIRSTFGTFKGDNAAAGGGGGYRMRTVFVMGAMLNWRTNWMAQLREEARHYGDLLVGNHQDDYYRPCFKFANSMKMARNFCGRQRAVDFVMLLDDNFLFFPWELIKEAERHSPEDRLYAGHCYDHATPFRNMDSKWAISCREYPFTQYPPYCGAGSVLLSRQVVHEFYLAIQHVEFFAFDDIYAGILAGLLKIRAQHIPKFLMEPPLLCQKGWKKHIDWPWCNDLREVISVHGYSRSQIRQIYEQIRPNPNSKYGCG